MCRQSIKCTAIHVVIGRADTMESPVVVIYFLILANTLWVLQLWKRGSVIGE